MSEFATERDRAADLIFDWNEVNRKGRILPKNATFFDETLRDGLQNPSVVDPGIEEKLKILHLMEDLGIHVADVGLPGSSKRAFEDVLRLCKEVVDCKMKIGIACAGRTVVGDITPMIEVSQRAGIPVEVYAFIGSSPIRQFVENWDVELIAKRSAEAIDVAVKAGLPVAYVTEDTTRSRPEVLTTLFRAAIDHGASAALPLGHRRPRDARRRAQPDPVHEERRRRHRRRDRHRLARPQRSRARARERASGRSSTAPIACTRPASASASAWATRRWSSCSST